MKYVASCSFGKDSLAMVLRLLEKGYPLDEVIFFDTGKEFKAIYNNMNRLEKILSEKNIRFTRLESEYPFDYQAFERKVNCRDGSSKCGYGWCGGTVRWGTSSKTDTIHKHYKEIYGDDVIVEYVGIAVDEQQRIKRERSDTVKIYQLAEWGMTEKDCLDYCYEHGWNWQEDSVELYDVLDRVSCWCCSNKNLKELRNIYHQLPEYWGKLMEYEKKCGMPYKKVGVKALEERFSLEDAQITLEEFL